MLCLPHEVTLEIHQALHLPRKKTLELQEVLRLRSFVLHFENHCSTLKVSFVGGFLYDKKRSIKQSPEMDLP